MGSGNASSRKPLSNVFELLIYICPEYTASLSKAIASELRNRKIDTQLITSLISDQTQQQYILVLSSQNLECANHGHLPIRVKRFLDFPISKESMNYVGQSNSYDSRFIMILQNPCPQITSSKDQNLDIQNLFLIECRMVAHIIEQMQNFKTQIEFYTVFWQKYTNAMFPFKVYQKNLDRPWVVIMAEAWGKAFEQLLPKMVKYYIQLQEQERMKGQIYETGHSSSFMQSVIDIYLDPESALSYGHSRNYNNNNILHLVNEIQQSTQRVYERWNDYELDIVNCRKCFPEFICNQIIAIQSLNFESHKLRIQFKSIYNDSITQIKNSVMSLLKIDSSIDNEYHEYRIASYDFARLLDELINDPESTIPGNSDVTYIAPQTQEQVSRVLSSIVVSEVLQQNVVTPIEFAQQVVQYLERYCTILARIEDKDNHINLFSKHCSPTFMNVTQTKYSQLPTKHLGYNMFS